MRSRFLLIPMIVFLIFPVSILTGDDQTDTSKKNEPEIEVVVTASRIEENTKSIPNPVTVITADQIAQSGKSSVSDVLEENTGINFRTAGNESKAEVTMRGFGENSFGRVLVLLNGQRLNRPDMAGINWLAIPVGDIDRIEIIRGSGSVFYGDNAVAGVINIITKKSKKDFSFDLSAMGGSNLFNREQGGISGNIDKVGLQLNGERLYDQGARERSALDSISGSMSLTWKPDEKFDSSFNASYNQTYSELPGSLTKKQLSENPDQAANESDEDNIYFATVNFSTKNILDDWISLNTGLSYSYKFKKIRMTSWSSYSDVAVHTFGLTPRLTTDTEWDNGGNRIITGTDLSWDILNIKRYTDASYSTLKLAGILNKVSGGIYAQDELKLFDSITANAGARYDLGLISADSSTTPEIIGDKYHNAFVYDVGLAWNFVKDSKLFAKFATVYRYPFIDEQVSYSGYGKDGFNCDLKAEKGYSVDTGIGVSFFEKTLNIESGFFLLDMEDEISYNAATSRNENLDKTRHMGVESQLSIPIKDVLELKTNYTYTYAYFLEGANSGKEIPLVSNHMVNAQASFFLPFGFVLTGSFRFVSDFFQGQDFTNSQDKVSGYKVIDLSFRYRPDYVPGKLELSFDISNLLDEKYATTAYYGKYYPAPGFTWKLGVSYRY